MKFLNLQHTIRSFLEKKHFFFITYFLFLLGFFVFPSTHWHSNFFYAIILFPYLITLQFKRIQLISRSNLWVLSMVFASYMCLTLLWADNVGFKDYVYHLRRLIYLFVFLSLTIELVLRYPKFIDCLFTFLCWIAAITAVISIIWFFITNSFPKSRLGFLGGQVQNPVEGAIVYGMVALCCCFHGLKTKKSSAWIYAGLTMVILVSVALTQGRTPLGSLFVTFLIGAIITRNKKLFVIVLSVILFGVLMVFYLEGIKEIITRRGFSYRFEVWQQTLPIIKEAFLFGEGISTEIKFIMSNGKTLNHCHSVYLGITLHGGFIGLFMFFIIQAFSLWESFLYFLRENDFTYTAVLLFSFICITTVNYRALNHPDAFWMYFWFPLALLAGKKLSSDKAIKSFYSNVVYKNEVDIKAHGIKTLVHF